MKNNITVTLLVIAWLLMIVSGIIFAILSKWLFAAIIWVGSFCCAIAAYNFSKGEK